LYQPVLTASAFFACSANKVVVSLARPGMSPWGNGNDDGDGISFPPSLPATLLIPTTLIAFSRPASGRTRRGERRHGHSSSRRRHTSSLPPSDGGGGTSQHDVIACILLQPEHNHLLTFSFRRQLLPNVFTDGHHRKRPSIKSRDAFFTGIQAALSTFSRLTYGALKPCNNSNI